MKEAGAGEKHRDGVANVDGNETGGRGSSHGSKSDSATNIKSKRVWEGKISERERVRAECESTEARTAAKT